jgi:hypothetical protein
MRAFDDLQAAVLARSGVNGDEGAGQEREEDAVLIPVAVVLMPGPRAANARVLHDHLRVIVINLTLEDLLGRADDRFATGDHTVNGVAGVVPQGETDGPAFAVGASEGVLVERSVLAGSLAEEADLVGVEHALGEDEAVAAVGCDLLVGEGAGCHQP